MEQNTVTINQLIAQILDEMRRIGYSETTIWRYYQPAMGQFRKYYVQTGQAAYSPEITDEYISLNKERYERGEVTYQSFKKTRYVGRRMNEFFLSGQSRYTSPKWSCCMIRGPGYRRPSASGSATCGLTGHRLHSCLEKAGRSGQSP